MRLEIHDDLDSLAECWEALWRADPRATPFQAPACLLPWARIYAPGRAFAVAAWRDDRLSALAPAFHWRGTLFLAGSGPLDYGDGLFLTECGAEILEGLAQAADQRGLERIELRQLRADSPLASVPPPADWRDAQAEDVPCPIAPISGIAGLSHLSGKIRAGLRQSRAKALRAARMDMSLMDAREGLPVLIALHERRWADRIEPSAIADPLMRAFLFEAAPALERAGLWRLHVLRLDGAPAAAILALLAPGAIHFYLQGIDPAWAALAPGIILLAQAIEMAAQEGRTHAHYLRGTEPYKARWGASGGQTRQRLLTRLRKR